MTKMIYYKLVKVTIDAPSLRKVIINLVIYHHSIPKSIVMDWDLLFTLQFWFLFDYFLSIKIKLFTVFYPQMNG